MIVSQKELPCEGHMGASERMLSCAMQRCMKCTVSKGAEVGNAGAAWSSHTCSIAPRAGDEVAPNADADAAPKADPGAPDAGAEAAKSEEPKAGALAPNGLLVPDGVLAPKPGVETAPKVTPGVDAAPNAGVDAGAPNAGVDVAPNMPPVAPGVPNENGLAPNAPVLCMRRCM